MFLFLYNCSYQALTYEIDNYLKRDQKSPINGNCKFSMICTLLQHLRALVKIGDLMSQRNTLKSCIPWLFIKADCHTVACFFLAMSLIEEYHSHSKGRIKHLHRDRHGETNLYLPFELLRQEHVLRWFTWWSTSTSQRRQNNTLSCNKSTTEEINANDDHVSRESVPCFENVRQCSVRSLKGLRTAVLECIKVYKYNFVPMLLGWKVEEEN